MAGSRTLSEIISGLDEPSPFGGRSRAEAFSRAMSALPPSQFAREVAKAALEPIAYQMIETAITRRLFPVDTITTPTAMYTTKRRQRAAVIPKFGAPPINLARYERVTVTPYVIATAPEIERTDVDDALFDAAGDHLRDAGEEMGVMEDGEMLRLLASVAASVADPTSTNKTVPTVSAGPGGVGYVLDSNTYAIGSGVTAPTGGVAGDATAQDYLKVMALMRRISFNPTVTLMNPDGLARLMAQESFRYFLNTGSTEVYTTGRLQTLLGTTIETTPLMPQRSAYVMDPGKLAKWVERMSLSIIPETHGLRYRWIVWERVAPFVQNQQAIIRVQWYT